MKTAVALSPPSNQPHLPLLDRLIGTQRVAFIMVTLLTTVILAGWLVPTLGTRLPDGWALMKANTALAFLLANAGLLLPPPSDDRPRHYPVAGPVCASLVLLLAGTALLEHLGGPDLGLTTLLAVDSGASRPGLMSMQTAAYLTLLGLTLLLDGLCTHPRMRLVDSLTTLLLALTLVISAGYCFDALHLFGQSADTRTSPHTLLCMLLLAWTLLIRRTRCGFFSVLVGIGIGSHIARIALPWGLLLSFLLVGSGVYSTVGGWLPAPYAAALTASLISLLFFLSVIHLTRRINDLERDLRDMSLTDELTQVYNRRGFFLLGEHSLREARRMGQPAAVLFIDVDGLKRVNDTQGHDVGSQLLRDVASLLNATFRDNDVVARVGGDEFAIITHHDHNAIQPALERLAAATANLNTTGRKPYSISYSLGEVTTDSTNSESLTELMERADALMYERKQHKKASLKRAGTGANRYGAVGRLGHP